MFQNIAKLAITGLLGCLVLAVTIAALLRYFLASGYVWLQDLQLYVFALLVALCILWVVITDSHVRAGVLVQTPSVKWKSIEWIAFGFIPFGVIASLFLPDVLLAWRTMESSSELGGLAGYFVIKTVVWLALVSIPIVSLLHWVKLTRRTK